MSYEQAYSDHRYLWETYGPAEDMTGGYVDQDDLTLLLKSPTKATAKACLVSQIEYWFQVGPEYGPPDWSDVRLNDIAERYGKHLTIEREDRLRKRH